MKIKFFLLLLLVLAFSAVTFAQSVVITPKKVTYTRPKPLVDFKKTFTVNYPKVKAATPVLSKKIEDVISYEKNFRFTLKEEMTEIQWLEEADYRVGYNDNGILSIDLMINGTGAYPSGSVKTVVVDLKTGNKVAPANVFTDIDGLVGRLKEIQKEEIRQGIEEIKKDPDFSNENPADLFNEADFTAENLEGFAVDEKGVTFTYDYGFPHVIQALQPEGKYFLSWTEIKPFIKNDGLLGGFVR